MNAKQEYWFVKVDIDVACDKNLSIMARHIFTVLCTFADKDTRGCWPSNEKVADAVGVSIPTVKRAYKELEARGVITRDKRFSNNQQTSSYTLIIGHNAPCYGGVTSEPVGGSPVSHRTRINEQELKDSLTREARLPKTTDSSESPEDLTDAPVVFEAEQPVESPKPEESHNPNEVCSVKDAPNIMQPTAEYFLHKTGRKAFTWEEISAFRELSATQYPTRVQKEIDTAIKRFIKRGQSLLALTVQYIAGSLRTQPTRHYSGTSVKKRKPDIQPEHPELAPNVLPEVTPEESAALDAEIAAHPELWG